jgi:hypothetical protein
MLWDNCLDPQAVVLSEWKVPDPVQPFLRFRPRPDNQQIFNRRTDIKILWHDDQARVDRSSMKRTKCATMVLRS